ncbi:MAG: hypothetical protein J6Y43_06185, partial [Clostridia bacterium]|nr:hypothetical protein [Clostridia bacterium]
MPRKDTNATAHRLIQTFGSVQNVFNASAERLMTVNGVGKTIAAQIVLSAKLMRKISDANRDGNEKAFSSLENVKSELVSLFDGVNDEKFYFFLLDDAYKSVFRMEYAGNSDTEVFADTAEIARAITVNKAKFALMAHNHPSGSSEPSSADDVATCKFSVLCEIHGVRLADHIIVAKGRVYSYFAEGRLNYIREKTNFDKIV